MEVVAAWNSEAKASAGTKHIADGADLWEGRANHCVTRRVEALAVAAG